MTFAGLLVLYVPILIHAVDVWRSDAEFTFGFAVLPIAAVLLWSRRSSLAAAVTTGSSLGLVPLVAGLGMIVVSARINVHAVAGASFLLVSVGAIAFLYGLDAARIAAFPLAFLTAGLSLYRGLLNTLGFALQQITAVMAAFTASHLGVPVKQIGVDLFSANLHLVVAQACSGMDSLVALLCLGALIVGIGTGSIGRRAALLATVLPTILLANVMRVTLVLLLYGPVGSTVTDGIGHDILDLIVFFGAVAVLLVSAGALKCAPVIRVTRSSSV